MDRTSSWKRFWTQRRNTWYFVVVIACFLCRMQNAWHEKLALGMCSLHSPEPKYDLAGRMILNTCVFNAEYIRYHQRHGMCNSIMRCNLFGSVVACIRVCLRYGVLFGCCCCYWHWWCCFFERISRCVRPFLARHPILYVCISVGKNVADGQTYSNGNTFKTVYHQNSFDSHGTQRSSADTVSWMHIIHSLV